MLCCQNLLLIENFAILSGQIGPPKFNLSIDNQDMVVNIEPPLFPYGDLIDEFTYKLFIWKHGNSEKVHFKSLIFLHNICAFDAVFKKVVKPYELSGGCFCYL